MGAPRTGRISAVDLQPDSADVCIDLSGGEVLNMSCNLLVAADGANSGVRDMVGISASRVDYEQVAVVGNLQPEKAPEKAGFGRLCYRTSAGARWPEASAGLDSEKRLRWRTRRTSRGVSRKSKESSRT